MEAQNEGELNIWTFIYFLGEKSLWSVLDILTHHDSQLGLSTCGWVSLTEWGVPNEQQTRVLPMAGYTVDILIPLWDSSAWLHVYTKLLLCVQLHKAICRMKCMGRYSLPLLLSNSVVCTSSGYVSHMAVILVNKIWRSSTVECPGMPGMKHLDSVTLLWNGDFGLKERELHLPKEDQKEMLTVQYMGDFGKLHLQTIKGRIV